MSLLYKLSCRLLSVPAVLLRRDTSKDAELLALRHENAVLDRRGGDTQHLARRAPAHG